MRIAYFAHELADAAVQKRVRMLALAGSEVTLLGFERDRGGAMAAHNGIVLGRTQNRRLLQRVFAVLGAVPRALVVRHAWREADLIIARNLEMLALLAVLTLFGNRGARIAYECLDIHGSLLSRGMAGALIRAVERMCLARVALIITSSPAFERNYFRAVQRFPGRVVVAENKVLSLTSEIVAPPPSQAPWTIAWCGVLRCRRSFDILRRLAETQNGRVRVELWGSPALDQIPHFHDAVAASAHMSFRGAYKPEDLPTIYARAHFCWAVDFYEAGGNSDWLLPNRLYESLSFACVPIAVDGVETARWLEAHGVGAVLPPPLETSLDGFLSTLTPAAYIALRNAALRLDPGATRLTADSCRAFAAELAGALA